MADPVSDDPRTPGQVARERWRAEEWTRITMDEKGWDRVAAAVLAHDASARKARGEVMVSRSDTAHDLRGFIARLRAALDAQESPND